MKRFNTTGLCVPRKHYMADISGKLAKIKELIDRECYFTMNRARQYGKTTTLAALERALKDEYIMVSISFQGFGIRSFESPEAFCQAFIGHIAEAIRFTSAAKEYADGWLNDKVSDFDVLSRHITAMCEGKKVVLMIDEVDKTSNNVIFLHFLSMLREKFLARENDRDYTFHSVILAGVYDIKNIKLKMVQEGAYTPSEGEDKIYNSPWNIAVNFTVDMSFDPKEIASMLREYEGDHKTGMDIAAVAAEIHGYTSGYPFLVSRICQCIDEEQGGDWTIKGVQSAIKLILVETNTLFDDVIKNLENSKELSDYIYELLILGRASSFVVYDSVVSIGVRYGFFRNVNGRVAISNRIFELLMTDYFMEKDLRAKKQVVGVLQYDVVRNGRFDMELCLRKFARHYAEIYSAEDGAFLERHGRLLFLSYLKPLINGQGFYHIESAFTDLRRMDIVVDYGRQQFIVELKRWYGEARQGEGYEQLLGYMGSKGADAGYMLTFDFREPGGRVRKAEWAEFGGKRIFDVIV